MMKRISLRFVLCLLCMTIFYSSAEADRLIRRSDAQIISLGLGNLDEKKQTVLFRGCKDKEGKIYNLKEYIFQSGEDCKPRIFATLESLNIDGTVKASTGESCSKGQTCLRYVVDSPQDAEKVFAGAQKGDVIDVFVSKAKSDKPTKNTTAVDLILKLKGIKGAVTDTVTFKNVSASGNFVAKVSTEK